MKHLVNVSTGAATLAEQQLKEQAAKGTVRLIAELRETVSQQAAEIERLTGERDGLEQSLAARDREKDKLDRMLTDADAQIRAWREATGCSHPEAARTALAARDRECPSPGILAKYKEAAHEIGVLFCWCLENLKPFPPIEGDWLDVVKERLLAGDAANRRANAAEILNSNQRIELTAIKAKLAERDRECDLQVEKWDIELQATVRDRDALKAKLARVEQLIEDFKMPNYACAVPVFRLMQALTTPTAQEGK